MREVEERSGAQFTVQLKPRIGSLLSTNALCLEGWGNTKGERAPQGQGQVGKVSAGHLRGNPHFVSVFPGDETKAQRD